MAIERGAQELRPILTSLVAKAYPSSSASDEPRPKPPTLILPIDQGEELFLAEGKREAEQLLALLRATC